MKKIIFVILIFILFPANILALGVNSVTLTGKNEIAYSESFDLSLKINFSGLTAGFTEKTGVMLVTYDLVFDSSILRLSDDIIVYDFDSQYIKENNHYEFYSVVSRNTNSSDYCYYGSLYCSDYEASFKFYAIKDEASNTSVSVENIEVAFLTVDEPDKIYTVDDLVIIPSNIKQSHNVIVKPKEVINFTPPKEAESTTSTPPTPNLKTVTDNVSSNIKSNNNKLSSLEIEGYGISFDSAKNNYNLFVDSDVNSLNIKAEASNSKASVNIIGADDLKGHDNKVIIEVVAEDGSKNIYTIEIKEHMNTDGLSGVGKGTSVEKKNFTVDKKLIILIVSVVIVITIAVIIITIIRNRKLNKMLEQFDKF